MSGITPLNIPTKLATNPGELKKYFVTLKSKDGSELKAVDPKATRALLLLMNQHAVIGGAACHWGGPSAFAETMSAAHALMFNKNNWTEHFNFVNDAGHTENGLYALKAIYNYGDLTLNDLKGFRSIESKLTGHGEAHLYADGVDVSNGPLGSGVGQAQGLAMADKLVGNDRVTICTVSDGAAMEGEAKEAFAAIAGLRAKNKINPFVLIVSDNNTKLSGRIDDDSFTMSGSFSSLNDLGWDVRTHDGHDHQEVFTALEQALEDSKTGKAICLHLKTIKGYGVKSTVESASGGHGYPLKAYDEKLESFIQEVYQNQAPEEFMSWAKDLVASKPAANNNANEGVKKEKVQVGIAKACLDMAKDGAPLVSISCDLQGSTGIAPFHKEYPERSFDIGVAESNMISAAIGFSKKGFIPVVDTFAQFAVTKGNLPLIMSGLSHGPVIGLFSHTGFQDAADGASHQATTYFANTCSLPHTRVYSLSCSSEAEFMMKEAIKYFTEERKAGRVPDSVLFFYGRENFPQYLVDSPKYDFNSPQVLADGKDITIVATGPLSYKALNTKKLLQENSIDAKIINLAQINRANIAMLAREIEATGSKLVTLEDHQVKGGMGAMLTHALASAGVNIKVQSLGQLGEFGQSAYKADQLYDKFNMGEQAILKACKNLV